MGPATMVAIVVELTELLGDHEYVAAPEAVKVTKLPAQIVALEGLTTTVGVAFTVTGIHACAPLPQEFTGRTHTLPELAPNCTVTWFVPCPEIITAPGGAVQE